MPGLPAALLLIVPMALAAEMLFITGFRLEARLGWPRIHDRLRPPLLLGQLTLLLLLIWTLVAALNPRARPKRRSSSPRSATGWGHAC